MNYSSSSSVTEFRIATLGFFTIGFTICGGLLGGMVQSMIAPMVEHLFGAGKRVDTFNERLYCFAVVGSATSALFLARRFN